VQIDDPAFSRLVVFSVAPPVEEEEARPLAEVPSGVRVAFQAQDHEKTFVAGEGWGSGGDLAEVEGGAASWSPDGLRLAVGRTHRLRWSVVVQSVEGTEIEFALRASVGGPLGPPSWLDGDRLGYAASGGTTIDSP